jgi:hypothetical protein
MVQGGLIFGVVHYKAISFFAGPNIRTLVREQAFTIV